MPQPWHSQLQKCDPVTTYFHSFGDLVVDSNRFNEQECEPRVQNWKTVRRKMTLHMPTRGLHWAHPKGRCKQDPGVAVSILSTQWLAVPPGSRELGFHARLQLTSQSQEALRTSGRLIRCLSLSHQGRGRPSCTPASTCPSWSLLFLELLSPPYWPDLLNLYISVSGNFMLHSHLAQEALTTTVFKGICILCFLNSRDVLGT